MKGRRKQQPSSSPSKRSRKALDLSADVEDDEVIYSSEEDELGQSPAASRMVEDDNESEEENVDVKKVRLAREYLQNVDVSDGDSSEEDSDEDENTLSRKLRRKRQAEQGTLHRHYADKIKDALDAVQKDAINKQPSILSAVDSATLWRDQNAVIYLPKAHDLTPTCIATDSREAMKAVSGSKDQSVVLWDLHSQKRIQYVQPQWKKSSKDPSVPGSRTGAQVLAVALTEKYSVVGSHDGLVRLYDIRSNECVKTFNGHKGPVTSIAIQNDSLFTASEDRCIRHYNLKELLYLETLYGHQFGVQAIDCPIVQERPVSVGRDRTARAWKLALDTHLIFRGGSTAASADVVSCARDDAFLTGHEDGSIRMWNILKKRPLAVESATHGSHGDIGRPIVSLDSIKSSDVFATGSNDGYVNFWKMEDRSMDHFARVPIHGFCNALSLHPHMCLAAVGQEHRLGRWEKIAGAKNRIAIIPLKLNDN